MQTANENPLTFQIWGLLSLSRVLSWVKQHLAEALERQLFTHTWSRKWLVIGPTSTDRREDLCTSGRSRWCLPSWLLSLCWKLAPMAGSCSI